MRLPEIELDDRRFQDLVSEARTRISRSCPEWTEHNVSDPGITLIELFAWMTETLLYRVNRIPDKLHVALLELLGLELEPPTAATAELRFRLSAPADEAVSIPAGSTEVGTPRTVAEESTVFSVTDDFVIPGVRPTAYAVRRRGKLKSVPVAAGVARPMGQDQAAFASQPVVGDAVYLGFDRSLARLLLRVEVDCSEARGAGIDPEDPPLRWEVSTGDPDDPWREAEVLVDGTGGFNYGSGALELQLPPVHGREAVSGPPAYWLRCRLDERKRSGAATTEGTGFTQPPEIYSLTAAPIGALIPATHATHAEAEVLGQSDGTPGQVFSLQHSPVLASGDATLEVREPGESEWVRWTRCESFVESGPSDRHFVLDAAVGTVELGPVIRDGNGGWRQYGAVPPAGAVLRFTRYRYGGGRAGNVGAGKLSVLKGAVPGVASVTNPRPAFGGVDAESLASARARAPMEWRTRYRAVTAEDFEFLARRASQRVGRAVCVPPEDGGPVAVCVLPRVNDGARRLEPHELYADAELLGEVASYLDERRLVGTSIEVRPVELRGVSVVVNVQAAPESDVRRVQDEVEQKLYAYLNPLVGGALEGGGDGWEFGRPLNQGELYGLAHAVPGVEYVKLLRIYETDLRTGEQQSQPAGAHVALAPHELIASGEHLVKVDRRQL